MRLRLFVLIFVIAAKSFATHNRAGYISYTRVNNGGQYTYDFKIYTYTNPSSYQADRCEETLIFTNLYGNGSSFTLNCNRINDANAIPSLGSQQLSNGENCPEGVMLIYPYPAGVTPPTYGGVKVNIYEGRYTFGGPGTFVFGMIDPNLDANVNNVGNGNSQNTAFALLDTLRITNQLNYNNSPLVSNPPIDNACYHQQFCYNPGMQDPDNDSLSYSLMPFTTGDTTAHGSSFSTAAGATIPAGINVDPLTGDLCWNSTPGAYADQSLGEYDIDMLIKEYRINPVDGRRYLVASSIFAVQIYVVNCPLLPPMTIVASPTAACVEAGNSLSPPVTVTANDAGAVGGMDISASGVGLTGTNIGADANFSSNPGSTSATGILSWHPSCEAVHLNPYYFTIRAFDHHQPLADAAYATVVVQVVSPSVQNLATAVVGDSVEVTWNPPLACATNTTNPIVEYLVYRVNNCIQYIPSPCKTGVPASSGFQVIGTCTASPYYDNNNGQGLPAGNSYAYLVIAKFADGSLSMSPATGSSCITLHFGVPIITNVSVDTTDVNSGRIFIRWQAPVAGGLNFDTTKAAGSNGNNGPYYFSVHRLDAAGTYSTAIYNSTPKPYFAQLTSPGDISYVDTLIDTKTKSYKYKVYFYANGNYKGSSAPASSVFATGVGHDKKVVLNWASNTPWKDTLYYVFRQNYTNSGYTLVGTTHATTDTVYNLTNNDTCSFKIQSVGSYENPNIISPLYNFSQKICVAPIDDSPPCQPTLSIAGDCDASINKLTWTNPDHTCNINDVLKYYIYYTPRQDSTLSKIDSILNVNDTTYTTSFNSASIAGCYVIVAVDSAGNQSPLNNESCTDNCPEYELPNIFTPNGDNTNDMYVPVKNRYIRSVDFVLYNRWGEIVYENTNPALGWDGKTKQMKQMAPDGVYFYTCTVNEIHYYGIKEIKLKGFVQLLK